MPQDIPAQEQTRKWFRSHLLDREVELQDLIISAQLAASQDTLSGTQWAHSVKLLET